MKNHKTKKKRFTIKSVKKGAKGAISILLCLLITPFLSIALGLVEYSRYQEVLEITDEIYELTGLSVLSDYDNYIHNRFGLLAVSQEGDFAADAEDSLDYNIRVLGNQVTAENYFFTGQLPLTNTEILRQQVVDVSELAATTAVLAKDFNLSNLLDELSGLDQFEEVMNTIDDVADFTDELTTAIEKLETFYDTLEILKYNVDTAIATGKDLVSKVDALYRTLVENGITLPKEATLEEIEAAVSSFTDGYLQDFMDVYTTAKTLYDEINTIVSNLTTLKTSATDFAEAVKKASEAAESIASADSVDKNGAIQQATVTTMETILEDLEELVEETVSEISDSVIETAKASVKEIINSSFNLTGITDVVSRYEQIVYGNYLSPPLSETAKQDIIDFLKTVKAVYETNSGDYFLDFLNDKFVPKINNIINVDDIKENVGEIIEKAESAIGDAIEDGLISLLTKLVNIIKGLFNLNFFYDGELNAKVTLYSESGTSDIQDFLDALDGMFSAIETFKSVKSDDLNFIEKIKAVLTAIKDLFVNLAKLVTSIFKVIGSTISNLLGLAGDLVSGDMRELYERILISGYMTHNLPCRLDAGEYTYDKDGNKVSLNLVGEGLTSFSYNNIARPAVYTSQSVDLNEDSGSKFQGLASSMQNLKGANGTDTMFKGAELEYILGGTNSEIANQMASFFYMYFLRMALDLPSVFGSGEVNSLAVTANVAGWVIYILYIVAEPFCDVLLLVNGETVPLVRGKCWLTASGLPDFIEKLANAVLGEAVKNELSKEQAGNSIFGDELNSQLNDYTSSHTGESENNKNNDGGQDYRTHMLLLLFVNVDPDDQINRLSNLIELETAEYYRQQGKSFDMSKTYTVVQISADVTFNPFFDLSGATGGKSILPSREIKQTVSY